MNQDELDLKYMTLAYKEAIKAYQLGEVPVGAILVFNNRIISKTHNLKEYYQDASKHAEIIAISKGSQKLKKWRLLGATLYVTLEPCLMCTSLILQSRISRLVFGLTDRKEGAVISNFTLFQNKNFPKFTHGLLSNEILELMQSFFKEKRKLLK